MTFTAEEKRKCAERELRLRERVYPRWVEISRMRPDMAKREIELMQAIVEDYRVLEGGERLL